MTASLSGFLKIAVFILLGLTFRKSGILNEKDVSGLKKIILNVAIPSVLFISFANLEFSLKFIPVILVIFGLNLSLFWLGVLIYKLTGSKHRVLPLLLSTFNFALIGIPLYDSIYGIEYLHNYTMLGVGNEIFVWFVFYFMFRWFLTKGKAEKGINTGFFKSPIVWGIFFGCLASIFNLNISSSSNFFIKGIYETLTAASGLTTPLILIFIGFHVSARISHIVNSAKLVVLRLVLACSIGYLLKITVLNRVIESTVYSDSAFFLFSTLPAIFSVPILAADYITEDETAVLNNTIVLHSIVTIVLFALYTIFLSP
ncbi:MAG: AEC family transporter [Spirochaetales bacterium]|uniref:AEC family transporter n=1 Tax=Candidatus Thalassospirochaeta sargassi TaxID=3119039 RepID=A0AAJ1IC44_9SPIO|nr:AEC family transporter [Spirochaetales bacterium]